MGDASIAALDGKPDVREVQPSQHCKSSGEHQFRVPSANISTWDPQEGFLRSAEVEHLQTVALAQHHLVANSNHVLNMLWKQTGFRGTSSTTK